MDELTQRIILLDELTRRNIFNRLDGGELVEWCEKNDITQDLCKQDYKLFRDRIDEECPIYKVFGTNINPVDAYDYYYNCQQTKEVYNVYNRDRNEYLRYAMKKNDIKTILYINPSLEEMNNIVYPYLISKPELISIYLLLPYYPLTTDFLISQDNIKTILSEGDFVLIEKLIDIWKDKKEGFYHILTIMYEFIQDNIGEFDYTKISGADRLIVKLFDKYKILYENIYNEKTFDHVDYVIDDTDDD